MLDTIIPTKIVGPIKICGPDTATEVHVPLATFEEPLWFSVNRGARVTKEAGGIKTTLASECMTRSILFEAEDARAALVLQNDLLRKRRELEEITEKNSKFAKLQDWQIQIVANLIYLRLSFTTGDAAGHNMTTKIAEEIQSWLLLQYPRLKYVSISGNYCADKKNSSVNGILGRGKYVIAESTIPRNICEKFLRTTPEKIVNLNIKKNLLGSIIAGGVRTANAHFANMLLALYLATGQDAANIIEGSQGFTHAEVRGEDLYFSVTLPNIIVGTVGSGKNFDFVKENLGLLGCQLPDIPGANARRFAMVVAATVLCGELSLLAAQTTPTELMRSHIAIERKNKK